jgi:hypothetical protein
MKILRIGAAGLIIVVLVALGGLLGVYIGGNLAVRFTFLGVRGYEAAGLLGVIVGFLGGIILSILIFRDGENSQQD